MKFKDHNIDTLEGSKALFRDGTSAIVKKIDCEANKESKTVPIVVHFENGNSDLYTLDGKTHYNKTSAKDIIAIVVTSTVKFGHCELVYTNNGSRIEGDFFEPNSFDSEGKVLTRDTLFSFIGYCSEGLREGRHFTFGDDEGYLAYPPFDEICQALQYLKKYFD